MKKFGEFILSLVQPRKLAKYRNMHIALAILIFIVGMFIALGSQYMMSESFVQKEMPRHQYKGTLETLYKNPTTDQPDSVTGLMFRNIQSLTFSSNLDVAIDDKNNSAKLTNEVLIEKFTYGDLKTPIEVQIYFDLLFDDTAATNDKTSVLYNFYESNITPSTEEKILFYFGKNSVYYIKSSQIPLLIATSESGVNSGIDVLDFLINQTPQQYIKYDTEVNSTTINNALSYIRRIPQIFREPSEKQISDNTSYLVDNVDEVSFVNELFKVFNLGYSNISYVNIDNNTVPYTKYSETYYETLGIYHKVMKDTYEYEDGHYLDFTLVIDQNLNNVKNGNIKLQYFDYEGYVKQTRDSNTTYVLCVLGFDRLFYIYDLGQDKENNYNSFDYSGGSIFEVTSAGNYKYYLPKDASEISYNMYGELDTTKWTLECGKDDYVIIDDVTYDKPQNRHNENFYNAVYTTHSRSYLYSDLIGDVVTNKTFSKTTRIDAMLQSVVDQMVKINAANYELVYAIMAFLAVVLFPLVLVIIVWLMSKKLFMKRIRQYYALAALCYGATSVIAFIVGFFLPFDSYALFLMFFQAWWFIFVTYRINTDPKYNNDDYDENDEENNKNHKDVQFKKLKDADNIKASQIG